MEEIVKKEKLNTINFLYIASMVMFFLAWNGVRLSVLSDGGVYFNLWFSPVAYYSIGALVCYILGIIKIKKYNNKKEEIENYKYKINHFFGFFNFCLVVPLDFGLLFMVLTSSNYNVDYLSIIIFTFVTLFFLISFVLRSTIFKRIDEMGLRCFDINSFLYFFYATIMLSIKYLNIEINEGILLILILINFIITNISVYYPIKAMVYANEMVEYNPFTTVYRFVRRIIDMKIFFFMGLIFTILIGLFYLIGGAYSQSDGLINIYFIIALFYFGQVALKYFTFIWKKKSDESLKSEEEKFNTRCKITIFGASVTLLLTILLGALLVYLFNDSVSKQNQIWFILIQAGFVSFRIVFLILDIIKANKKGNPFEIFVAEASLLSMSVMIFSIVLSVTQSFGFNYFHKGVAIVMVFTILSSGVFISIHSFVLGMLGIKGRLKNKKVEE